MKIKAMLSIYFITVIPHEIMYQYLSKISQITINELPSLAALSHLIITYYIH